MSASPQEEQSSLRETNQSFATDGPGSPLSPDGSRVRVPTTRLRSVASLRKSSGSRNPPDVRPIEQFAGIPHVNTDDNEVMEVPYERVKSERELSRQQSEPSFADEDASPRAASPMAVPPPRKLNEVNSSASSPTAKRPPPPVAHKQEQPVAKPRKRSNSNAPPPRASSLQPAQSAQAAPEVKARTTSQVEQPQEKPNEEEPQPAPEGRPPPPKKEEETEELTKPHNEPTSENNSNNTGQPKQGRTYVTGSSQANKKKEIETSNTTQQEPKSQPRKPECQEEASTPAPEAPPVERPLYTATPQHSQHNLPAQQQAASSSNNQQTTTSDVLLERLHDLSTTKSRDNAKWKDYGVLGEQPQKHSATLATTHQAVPSPSSRNDYHYVSANAAADGREMSPQSLLTFSRRGQLSTPEVSLGVHVHADSVCLYYEEPSDVTGTNGGDETVECSPIRGAGGDVNSQLYTSPTLGAQSPRDDSQHHPQQAQEPVLITAVAEVLDEVPKHQLSPVGTASPFGGRGRQQVDLAAPVLCSFTSQEHRYDSLLHSPERKYGVQF